MKEQPNWVTEYNSQGYLNELKKRALPNKVIVVHRPETTKPKNILP